MINNSYVYLEIIVMCAMCIMYVMNTMFITGQGNLSWIY